jgi:hypothetical protein
MRFYISNVFFRVNSDVKRDKSQQSAYCNFIISSHVPVSENMKYLLLLADSNCRMSPAAIWILNNLFRYCMKLGPATMLFALCSRGLS